ncbi:MAG: YdcF family protein [Eubacteriales bacterium]|nr:YdcF family protein [Eubacteriales bacterium]
MKHNRFVNFLFLVFGVLCLLYYVGMGLAVRFGQSLLWLWPAVGVICIIRYALVRRSIKTGEPLPFSGKTVKAIRIVTVFCVGVFLIGEAVICTGAFQTAPDGLDCIIVLGAKVNGTKPSGALSQRIWAASSYMLRNPDTVCIVSGGMGDGEDISEAECMRRYMTAQGVDGSRIIMEDRATDTHTNLVYSLPLLPAGTDAVGIVTNDFHLFRALAAARKLSDLDFYGISAKSTPYGFVHYAMREFFAVGEGLMKGELKF